MPRLNSLARTWWDSLTRWVTKVRGALYAALDLRPDRGQVTAEYGLILLVAGTLALTLLVYIRSNGGLNGLFDAVVSHLTDGIS